MRNSFLWRFEGHEPKEIHQFLEEQSDISLALRILVLQFVGRYGTVDIMREGIVDQLINDNSVLKKMSEFRAPLHEQDVSAREAVAQVAGVQVAVAQVAGTQVAGAQEAGAQEVFYDRSNISRDDKGVSNQEQVLTTKSVSDSKNDRLNYDEIDVTKL